MRDPARVDWLLWQLADSAFPTGGFTHSGGLEAAVQHGELKGRDDLVAFLDAAVVQCGSSAIPFVRAAWETNEGVEEFDLIYDAFTSNHIANRASRAQGRAFLSSAERAFSLNPIKELRETLLSRAAPTHFAPVFGVAARMLWIERMDALRLFLFTQIRGWISSAVRLGIVGPIEAQSIQARLAAAAERTLEQCAEMRVEQVAQTAPLIDLFQGGQDRLYSRLFQS